MQDIILLQCTSCKHKNYSTTKNKKNTKEKLNLKKYCKHCREHVIHKETKA
ncbi:MAG: 50S ribosomal protein L33 [Thermodesulfovibrionia bacterium]|nr:50S ribosomal protein L33 [Thermodesulfovibrionia bacterium]